jgi:hypothetical protein
VLGEVGEGRGPTKDTRELVFAPLFVRGLDLPICSFVQGLFNFYAINLTHLNTNSILQIIIFIHSCEVFLRIVPHFRLWKYLYHCKPTMREEVLQVVGGGSPKLRHG